MNDLTDRLARLGDTNDTDPGHSTVTADLRRGHAALKRRRFRRAATGATAVLAVAATATLVWPGVGSAPATPSAHSGSPAHHTTTHHTTTHHTTTNHQTHKAIRLVAYHGKQLPGFTVATVPEGYVLQGSDNAVLDIAEAGDDSPLSSFIGKLVITVSDPDEVGTPPGDPVTVNGKPGVIRTDEDGITTLDYTDGKYLVDVQSWNNIAITQAQLVQFAGGITVTDQVAVSHG